MVLRSLALEGKLKGAGNGAAAGQNVGLPATIYSARAIIL